MVQAGKNKIAFQIGYIEDSGEGEVLEKTTDSTFAPVVGRSVIYLDRQKIKAPEGWGLKGFKLERSGSGILYRYWIQKVKI